MDIKLSSWSNEIKIWYYLWNNSEVLSGTYTNKFLIKSIINSGFNIAQPTQATIDNVTLEYNPYRIACKIKNWNNELNKITLIINVNEQENADYCFEVNNKNCRLIELPISKCETIPG